MEEREPWNGSKSPNAFDLFHQVADPSLAAGDDRQVPIEERVKDDLYASW